MKIALLFEFATLNGGERSMLATLDWLKKYDSEFEFVAIGPASGRLANALFERDITLVGWSPVDQSGRRYPQGQIESSLCQIVASLQPDLLHANSLAMGRLIGRLACQLSMPTTAHLRDILKLSAAAVKDLNDNRRLIAVSNATRKFHIDQGVDDARVFVVHNGVDLEEFQPRPISGSLHAELRLPWKDEPAGEPFGQGLKETTSTLTRRRSMGRILPSADASPTHRGDEADSSFLLSDSAKFIAMIGQIGLRKGQDVLVAAARDIVQQVPNAHFLFIGERTSQKEESIVFERDIHRGFELAGLSDRLHMLGHRDDVATLLNEIDILVHPANQEPFGRVLLEASASGVPIVAADVGGTREIIEDRLTGYLVPARNPQSLSNAVVRILNDKNQSQQLRNAARARAVSKFSISIAAQNLAAVWSDVLKR